MTSARKFTQDTDTGWLSDTVFQPALRRAWPKLFCFFGRSNNVHREHTEFYRPLCEHRYSRINLIYSAQRVLHEHLDMLLGHQQIHHHHWWYRDHVSAERFPEQPVMAQVTGEWGSEGLPQFRPLGFKAPLSRENSINTREISPSFLRSSVHPLFRDCVAAEYKWHKMADTNKGNLVYSSRSSLTGPLKLHGNHYNERK